ncbi:hypothetical protein CI109_103397 [Kwoniella shandongensis]|uniref:Uncharacterized protein n=1 Tax=Kwoniella shandongensis TaxID=1734106 RepID=A0A5M6BWD2_9TREE|nr:uncharacterized protein CI109_004478 [Kwoniella shandongensis]KAA5527186.1 hypothetical protein CI109_004478 [Kwoniella shandongensis]
MSDSPSATKNAPAPSAVPLSPVARSNPARRPSPPSRSISLSSTSSSSSSLTQTPSFPSPSPIPGISAPPRFPGFAPMPFLASNLPPSAYHFISQNIGLTLVAVSQLFMVFMSLTVKYFLSTTHISTFTLIFVRMGITSVCCIVSSWLVRKDPNPILGPEGIRMKLVQRGIFGWIGLLSSYQSLRGLTVSDSVTIQFLSPTVTAILGYVFLKETMNRREVLAGLCCLTGVVLVSRPPFLFGGMGEDVGVIPPDEGGGTRLDLPSIGLPGEGDTEGIETPERAVAVAWAFMSVLGASVAYTTIRSIGNKAHALHSIGYFSYMCTITCGLWLLVDPKPLVWVESTRDFLFIVAIGFFGFVYQMLLTMGLQREKAGRAGLALYLQVVFALVLEFVLWHTIPSFLSALGTTIILVSAFWAALSTTAAVPSAKQTDPEAQPFSRSPSPIPPPHSERPLLRGEHYSYETVPTTDPDKNRPSLPSRKPSLGVPPSRLPLPPSRRGSSTSTRSASSPLNSGNNNTRSRTGSRSNSGTVPSG